MGRFANVAKADSSQAARSQAYLTEGNFKVKILQCKAVDGRKGDLFFIIQMEVIESSVPSIKPGSVREQVINLGQDAGPGNVKAFIAAAEGLDPTNKVEVDAAVDEETTEYVVSKDQPLAGRVMDVQCTLIKTKAGGDFTKHTWMVCAEASGTETDGGGESAA